MIKIQKSYLLFLYVKTIQYKLDTMLAIVNIIMYYA